MKENLQMSTTHRVKPFLKWAGGKKQLLGIFNQLYPESLKKGECTCYLEPFLGGGAVYFDLVQKYPLKSAYLADINPEIIIAYKVIQKSVESLIEQLADLAIKYQSLPLEKRQELYYQIRENYNQQRIDFNYLDFSESWVKRSAMLIFLNKTCFNGLFRLNKSGEFNVPYGRYKNPTILNQDNLIAISIILQNVDIELANFTESIKFIKDKSFMYLDPPYRPLNKTSNFTSYSKFVFDDTQQIRLANFYKQLNAEYNINLMLSNSDPHNEDPWDNFFDELYQEFNIHRIPATRMINSKAHKRGTVTELVITNY
ncbi:MAG: DNA adenine methylase [Gloeocapsa sp. DLM2.Bin57]|nr:MAG: DNA adenine methylase [Gloeocapsa sp. DLM2.Bin57]